MVEAFNADEDYVQIDTPRPGTVEDRAREEEVKQVVDEEAKEEVVESPQPKKSMLAAAMENAMKDYEAKVTLATEAELNGEEQEEMKVDSSAEAATEPSTQFSFHPKGAGEVDDDIIESAIEANGTAIDEDMDLAVKK